MKMLWSFSLLLFTSLCGPEIQASSSSSLSEMSCVSSVIVATQIKQPNAVDFAEMLLRKTAITRSERDKAIALLEARKPLAAIEEARRKLARYSENLNELEGHIAKSTSDELMCRRELTSFKIMQDTTKDSYERAVPQQVVGNVRHAAARSFILLNIISTAQEMLIERADDSESDDQKSKKIQQLLYQLNVSERFAQKPATAHVDDNDDDNVDDFFELGEYAEELFENAQRVEQQRLDSIVVKHRQIGAVLESLAPLPDMIVAEAEYHRRNAERVKSELTYTQERLKKAKDELTLCEELTKRLKSKTVL